MRTIDVRIVPSSNPIHGWSVVEAGTKRVLDGVIPDRYSDVLRACGAGGRVELLIHSDEPPEVDPTTQDVRVEPVILNVVSSELLWTPTEGQRYTTGFGAAEDWRWTGAAFGVAVALLVFLLVFLR